MKYYSQQKLNQLLGKPFHFDELDANLSSTTDANLVAYFQFLKKHSNAAIFIGWIENWSEVLELLTKEETNRPFSDYLNIQSHTLFPLFKQFVTPFLFPILLKHIENKQLNHSLEYLILLEADTRVLIESKIYNSIEVRFSAIAKMQQEEHTSENQLIEVVQEALNNQIIQLISSFSKQSYAFSVGYVEHCFAIIESKGCTLRLANWIVIQLQQLQLNEEHLLQLNKLKKDLKNGIFKFDEGRNKHIKFNYPSLLLKISFVGLLTLISWIIFFNPFSGKSIDENGSETSSYTKFTVEERKHIDSLIKTLQSEPVPMFVEQSEDESEWRELLLNNKKSLANKRANAFYQVWNDYLSTDTLYSSGTCKNLTKSINLSSLPDNFTKLTAKKNGKPSVIRNESEYAVQLVIFKNKTDDAAYYYELRKDEQIACQLSDDEYIGVIAGKFAIPYSSNSTKSIVFCEHDNATLATFSTFYSIKPNKSFNYKFLISGKNETDFQLIDVYGVLNVIK